MLEIIEPFKAFAELKEKAVEVMPMLKENMDTLTHESLQTMLNQSLRQLRAINQWKHLRDGFSATDVGNDEKIR